MSFQVCVCFVTRRSEAGTLEVLLGRKKTGLGAGNIVGLGGKLEPGETALEAIVREVEEESGLIVDEVDLAEKPEFTVVMAKPLRARLVPRSSN